MESYIIRMASEKAELDIKLDKLETFLNGNHELDATRIGLMKNQCDVMERYSDILNMRLKLEGKE